MCVHVFNQWWRDLRKSCLISIKVGIKFKLQRSLWKNKLAKESPVSHFSTKIQCTMYGVEWSLYCTFCESWIRFDNRKSRARNPKSFKFSTMKYQDIFFLYFLVFKTLSKNCIFIFIVTLDVDTYRIKKPISPSKSLLAILYLFIVFYLRYRGIMRICNGYIRNPNTKTTHFYFNLFLIF